MQERSGVGPNLSERLGMLLGGQDAQRILPFAGAGGVDKVMVERWDDNQRRVVNGLRAELIGEKI